LGRLSTHVLDTSAGRPAAGVPWVLYQIADDHRIEIGSGVTNDDGRTDAPLLDGDGVYVGTYEIVFDVEQYFQKPGEGLRAPPFLSVIPIRFSIANADENYHVPLLVSPYGYSTYRGS